MSDTVTLLHHASIFLYWPTQPLDIEHERQRLEAEYSKRLSTFSIMQVKRHGIDCTKVTWEVV